MGKEIRCQKCGEVCEKTTRTFDGKTELGFTIPVIIYECKNCKQEHIVCPECNGDKFKIDFKSHSIFEDVNDCPECLGMGSIMIGDFFNA